MEKLELAKKSILDAASSIDDLDARTNYLSKQINFIEAGETYPELDWLERSHFCGT